MEAPTTTGQWRALDRAGREAWLRDAAKRHFARGGVPRTGTPAEIVLDGELFDDVSGFYCAMGEVVNGPGGYFGWDEVSFYDCLHGGFGLEAPYVIRWKSSARSRALLGSEALLAEDAARIAWIEANHAVDFAEWRERLLARAEQVRRGELTLFDDLVQQIRSVSKNRTMRIQPVNIQLQTLHVELVLE